MDFKLTQEQLECVTSALKAAASIADTTGVHFASHNDMFVEIDGQQIGVRFKSVTGEYEIDHRSY